MADWDGCKKNLYWSANHEMKTWKSHSAALNEYVSGDEDKAFGILLSIQDHDEGVQDGYKSCRQSDKTRFWKLAQDVYAITGPRNDV